MSRLSPDIDTIKPDIKVTKPLIKRAVPYIVNGGLVVGQLLASVACDLQTFVKPTPIEQNEGEESLGLKGAESAVDGAPVRRPTRTPRPTITSVAEIAFPSPVSLQRRGDREMNRVLGWAMSARGVAVPVVEGGERTEKEIAERGIDPYSQEHIFALCLSPDWRVAEAEPLRRGPGLALVSFESVQARPEELTKEQAFACFEKEEVITKWIKESLRFGVDLKDKQVQAETEYHETTYKGLPQLMVDMKVMTPAQARIVFGPRGTMTFKESVKDKDGKVIAESVSWGPATFLEDKAEVERRRAAGEKMVFWTGEGYKVFRHKNIVLIFREDCTNILIFEIPQEAPPVVRPPRQVQPPAPSATPTETEVEQPTPTNTATQPAAAPAPAPAPATPWPTTNQPPATATPGQPGQEASPTPTQPATATATRPPATPTPVSPTATLIATQTPVRTNTPAAATATPRIENSPTAMAPFVTATPRPATATLIATQTPVRTNTPAAATATPRIENSPTAMAPFVTATPRPATAATATPRPGAPTATRLR